MPAEDNVYDRHGVTCLTGRTPRGVHDTTIDRRRSPSRSRSTTLMRRRHVRTLRTVELEVAENTATNTNIGAPITAVDPGRRRRDLLAWPARTPACSTSTTSSGQVKTKAVSQLRGCQHSYTVSFTASVPQSNSASIDLTIKVTDDDTEAPGKPAKPAVIPSPGNGHEAIKVTWATPDNAGPAITGYVVQYRVEGSGDDWVQGDACRDQRRDRHFEP